jgi:hypothetical protein
MNAVMSRLLDEAMEAVRALPPEAQDDIARVMIELAGEGAAPFVLSPDERAVIAHSKVAAAQGQFASDEQLAAVWKKHGL